MGMAAIARRSGARVRRRRLAACAASAVMAAALAMPGGAPATPPTPVITATQSGALTARLTSSTGTHWSWTFLNAAAAVVGTSTLQSPLQAFPQAGDYTALVDATDDDPTATAPAHAQTTFHVYNTPTASFTYTVLAGGTVQFTDTSTGEPTSWQWTFPGGTFSGRTPPAQAIAPRTPPWRGHPDGGQSGRQQRRERADRRERTARRRAHHHAEPGGREHARDPQRERVDRSQRRRAALLLGSQRRQDLRRRHRRDPDADLHVARNVPSRGEGERPGWQLQ